MTTRVPMTHFISAANLVTLVGLWSAVSCALLAVAGELAFAIVALVVAGVCDLLDGAVARRMGSRDHLQRQFGARLDSVVDICSFGFAPVVLLWALGLQSALEMCALAAMVTAAAWRLAYFDTTGLVTGDGGGKDGSDLPRPPAVQHYVGLPTTYVALVLPMLLLPGLASRELVRPLGLAGALVLSIAMVSPLRIPKPRGIWYLVFPLIAVAVASLYVTQRANFMAFP